MDTMSTTLLLLLAIFPLFTSPARLNFAQWGKPCRILDNNNKDELIDSREECDASKGLTCEKYSQGNLCGCKLGGPLTYDPMSGECRRKVGAQCHIIKTPEEYHSTPFNRKCHFNAECLSYNGILVGNNRKPEPDKNGKEYCYCKEGFKPRNDLSGCVDPNGGESGMRTSNLGVILISIVFVGVIREL